MANRDRLFARLATAWRLGLARHVRGGPAASVRGPYDRRYWEHVYDREDPWGFASKAYEKAKYALTLDLCGNGPFGRALEIGCSEGVFTELLAPRCERLMAIDISSAAVGRAERRLEQYPWVKAVAKPLPAEYPNGEFDLIVASDVLYYLANQDIPDAASRIERSLAPAGRFVALHYALPIDHAATGDFVHDILAKSLSIPHVHSESRDIGAGRPYRIDVWERPIPGSTVRTAPALR